MEILTEEEISRKRVFSSPSININKSNVRVSDGRFIERYWIEHNGSVAIIARNSEGLIALEEQYRFGIRAITHEIPAGHIEEGESIKDAAMRELLEETGCKSESLIYLGYFTPAGSTSTEKTHLFFADNVYKISNQKLDSDESLNVNWVKLEYIDSLITDGLLWDPKTICALYHAKLQGLLA